MKMRDTEGAPLINNHNNDFDINLWGDGEMALAIPLSIDMGEEYYKSGGEHVLSVSLRDILEEYLIDNEQLDGGEGLLPLAKLLDEYAEKYKTAQIILNKDLDVD